jgi:hypothetical protein
VSQTRGLILDPSCPVEWGHPLNLGLVGHWMVPPNPGWSRGLTLRDLVRGGRNPNDGTLANGPAWTGSQGRQGGHGALSLDGTNDYVSVPDSASLSPTAALTVSGWWRQNSLSADKALIAKWNYSTQGTWALQTEADSSALKVFVADSLIEGGNNHCKTATGVWSAGAWHHVAFVFDGAGAGNANRLKIYVDGIEQPLTFTGTIAAALQDSTAELRIGDLQNLSRFWNGSCDDVRIYSRALSATGVRADRQESSRRRPETLRWLTSRSWFVPPVIGILFDSASNSGYKTANASYSWSHTCTGSNRILLVGISMLSVAGSSVSSITYNGVALSLIRAKASVTGAVRVELWGLVAPATGSNTIEVTLSVALDSIGGAISLTGVNQTSPYEGDNDSSATNVGAADATVNVTTVADNDLVVDVVASDDTAITVGAGQTQRNNVTGTLGSGAMSTEGPKTPAGSVTSSWTDVGALATWSIVSVGIRPVAASNIYSLVIGGGSYSLTGSSVNLKRGYPLSAGVGSYSLSGLGTSLNKGYREAVGTGSYTLNGTAVSLKGNRVITAGAGSYLLNGSSASIEIGYKSTAGIGSYSILGSDVSTKYDRHTNVSSGAYSLNGSSIGLYKDYSLTIVIGSYIVPGSSVILKEDKLLQVTSGVILVTGSNVGIEIERILSAGIGSYTLAGFSVGLTYTVISIIGGRVAVASIYSPGASQVGIYSSRISQVEVFSPGPKVTEVFI